MKRKKGQKKQQSLGRFQIATGILIIISVLILKFYVQGSYLMVWEVVEKIVREKRFRLEYVFFFFHVCMAVLYLIRTILLLVRKRAGIFYQLATLSLLAACLLVTVLMQMQNPAPYMLSVLWLMIVSLIEFLYIRYSEQREEINKNYEEQKKRERKEKEHRKRADYFPGKYSKLFYEVIQKNFRYHWKEQAILTGSGALIAAIGYIIFAMYRMTEEIYGGKGEQSFMFGEGIHGVFQSFGRILLCLGILMMTMILSWYIKEQNKEYRLMVILGMRKKTAYTIFGVGFMINFFISAVVGLLVGIAGAVLLRQGFQNGFHNGISLPGVVNPENILTGLGIYLLYMVLSLGLNQESIVSLGKSTDIDEEKKKGREFRKGTVFWIVLGGCLYILGILWFAIREWAETMMIYILPVAGMFLLLSGGMAFWMKKRKGKEVYYRTLFRCNPFYYQFWKWIGKLFYLAVLQFLVLAVFSPTFISSLMKQDFEQMYPYDIVCMVYEEDAAKIKEIAVQNDVQISTYPMVRMTSLYGSDQLQVWGGTRPIQWPQGQHIAISETSYRKLKEAAGQKYTPLNLKGQEIHIVYQQDLSVKSHTIDWDTSRVKKHLRFGQPLHYYNTADYQNVFPVRTVKSEERNSLTGIFQQGMQENLIVLPDKWFKEEWSRMTAYNAEHWEERMRASTEDWRNYTYMHDGNMTEGPTMLCCMNIPDSARKTVIEELEHLKEEYRFDQIWDFSIQPFYEKVQMMSNTESEILFSRIANGFGVLILVLMGLFQYYVNIREEENKWKREDKFLKQMGMHEKERKSRIWFQMRVLVLIPVISGMIGGICYTGLTLHARLFTVAEIRHYLIIMLPVYVLYLLLWFGFYKMMRGHVTKYLGEDSV